MNRYPNCSTELNGPYCHECGQHQEDLDRPIRELASEGLSAFFALRRVYGQGRLITTGKFMVLLVGYALALVLTMIGTLVVTVALL